MKATVSAKIALLAFFFTLLGVLWVAYLGFLSVDKLLKEDSYRELDVQLHWQSKRLLMKLDAIRRDVENLARFDHSRALLEPVRSSDAGADVEKARFFLESWSTAILRDNPAYRQVRLLGVADGGREVLRMERGETDAIVTVSGEGLQRMGSQPFFSRTLATPPDRQYISDVDPLRKDGDGDARVSILRVSKPVRNIDGESIGMVVIDTDFNRLFHPMRLPPDEVGYFLATDGGAYLHFSDGRADPMVEAGRGDGLARDYPQVDFSASFPGDHAAGNEDYHEFLSATRTVDLDDRHSGLAWCKLFFDPWDRRRHFILGAVTSHAAIENKSRDYFHEAMNLAMLVAVGLGVIIALAVRGVTRPIRLLTDVAERIAADDEEWVEVPRVGSDDEVGALSRTFREMLDRLRRTHIDLRRMTANQERQIRERTADLARARDQALEASRAKSQFLATMSHEIRTPMNVVLGMLELLRDSDLAIQSKEQVELAYGSGKALLTLINNVLDFSKIEAGQLSLDQVDFDLRQLVDEVAMTLASLAHAREIELTAFFPSGPTTAVRGDSTRLRQIFTNLLGNAIKFTPEGGVVELHGGPVGQVGERVEFLFEVRDTGIGISKEHRENIFSQFTQVDGSSTRPHEGTGLGLAICKHLVERMDGEIGVDVNPFAGSGSVFHFTVLLERQKRVVGEGSDAAALKGLRILAVASDGLQQTLLENILVPRGARLDHMVDAETAPEVLYQAEKHNRPYDLLIFNQKPGRSDGRTFRKLLRVEREPRFILLTDLMDQGWDQAAEMPGTAICLKKPISAERLNAAINWLKRAEDEKSAALPHVHHSDRPQRSYLTAILLVDDQKANLTVARSLLISLGCVAGNIDTALNGGEAFALVKAREYDLIFMDCQMPVMDGYQATRAIRAWEGEQGHSPVPIIAFTADITPKSRELVTASGMDYFLSKPVTKTDLQTVLDRYATAVVIDGPLPEALEPRSPERSPVATSVPEKTAPESGVDLNAIKKSLESIGLPEEDFQEVADLLSKQFMELLQTIEQDLEDRDFQTARATAHVIKGSMANTIFPKIQRATRTLYERIRNKEWDEARDALIEVRNQFTPIQKALLAYLKSKG